MKKLLTILGAVGLMATTGATVIACGTKDPEVKGDFDIKANEDAKYVRVGDKLEIAIDKFTGEDGVKAKFENFDVVLGEGQEDKTVSVDKTTLQDDGKITITGKEVGNFEITFTAFTKKDDGDKFTDPEPDAKSGMLKLEVKEAAKDIKEFLTEEKLALGEVKDDAAATTAAQAVIDSIAELKGKVTLAEPSEGTIKVTVNEKEDGLIGEAEFTYVIKA